MSTRRRTRSDWTPEQQREALNLAVEHGVKEAARRAGIPVGTIGSWRRRLGISNPRPDNSDNVDDDRPAPLTIAKSSRPAWSRSALCAGTSPGLFVADRRGAGAVSILVDVCRSCAYREACLEVAVADPDLHGMWGGTGSRERVTLRRNGELVDRRGDGILYDPDTGAVIVIENEQRPPLPPGEARALLESLAASSRERIAS